MNTRRLEAVNAVTALHEVLPKDVPLEERISTIRLKFSQTGIIDPLSGKKLEDCFDFSDPLQRKVSEINLKMAMEVKKRDGVGIWLNPSGYTYGEYHETGKILVAARNHGDPVLYDLTDQTFSPKEFASFMVSLSPFCRDGYYFLTDMPWDMLEGIIPIPKVWQAIRSDQAEQAFNREVEEMETKVDKGGVRESILAERGVDINRACNTGGGAADYLMKSVSPDGKLRVFAKTCGMCGQALGKDGKGRWLQKGDCCEHCGEVYLGVC